MCFFEASHFSNLVFKFDTDISHMHGFSSFLDTMEESEDKDDKDEDLKKKKNNGDDDQDLQDSNNLLSNKSSVYTSLENINTDQQVNLETETPTLLRAAAARFVRRPHFLAGGFHGGGGGHCVVDGGGADDDPKGDFEEVGEVEDTSYFSITFFTELLLPWKEAFMLKKFFLNLRKKSGKKMADDGKMSDDPSKLLLPPPGSDVPLSEFGSPWRVRAAVSIVGMEILNQRERYVIYKLRVEDKRPWSVDNVPVWHIYRRYSDFLRLFKKIRNAFPDFEVLLPPRRWVGDNFDPVFLGRRMFRLQEFINQVFDDEKVRDFHEVQTFFSFTTPPNRSINVEFDRAIFDALEGTVNELREQLRQRQLSELEASQLREQLRDSDGECEVLRQEVDSLKRQKEGLLKALQEGGGEQQHFDDAHSVSLSVPHNPIGSSNLLSLPSTSRLSLSSSSALMAPSSPMTQRRIIRPRQLGEQQGEERQLIR